jgi:hypothetical protein
MRVLFKALGLWLLLLLAQQGAVVHELSHLSPVSTAGIHADSNDADGAAEKSCALCNVFAQVVTPAFSHSFDVPVLLYAASDVRSTPPHAAPGAAAPRPRSRGPPSLS